MRVLIAVVAAGWTLANAFGQEGWQWREVACETNGWYALRVEVAAAGSGLTVCQRADGNGFLLPRPARQRQAVAAEADLLMRERLGREGWNFAGVALYQDDGNYWMLALVEGPDGKHSVDFLENRAGVWQAQNEPKTALAREGNVSFAWKAGSPYRLRLSLSEGKVSAQVSEPADGSILGSASFSLGDTPAVRSGFPALIAHASTAVYTGFRFGMSGPPGGRALPGNAAEAGPDGRADRISVALLDEALPGHDRRANARLAEALEKRGFRVARLTADQMLAPLALTGDAFRVLVVPQCDAVPAALGPAAQQFAREGGHVIFLGGPFLDRALAKVGGAWLDREGQRRLLQEAAAAHRPFEIKQGGDLKGWRRSSPNRDAVSTLRAVGEGPSGAPCLRLDVPDFQGWDVFQSPELPALFGEGHGVFTFLAKGDPQTAQLAVEIIERDGARWIATAPLAPEWRRVGLRLADFLYWKDSSSATRRGHAGDRLRPENAVRVSIGLSASHTPAVGGGSHTVWLSEVGSARDPLAGVGEAAADMTGSIECVYPRYKTHLLSGRLEVSRGTSVPCTNVVCAISRTLGEGFERGGKWRFVPLAEAAEAGAKASGVCEWYLLNTRFPLDGTVVAGFGYTDPAVWSSPEVAGRIADVAERVTGGVMIEEAGTDRSAYWPGETARVGARMRSFKEGEARVGFTYGIKVGERHVSGGRGEWVCDRQGMTAKELGTFVPAEPGEYIFSGSFSGEGSVTHRFSVLDPAPARKSAFITARDGDFWLGGKKWYPVGVNYWPLYVSGMDHADYGAGWLKDAYYAPALVERDLVQVKDMGINLVSIQTPPQEHHRNLLDFLRLCGKYGIYVNVYMGQASPLAFNEAELKAYLQTARLADNAAVFAYDTIWEPGNHVFKDDAARAKWDDEWRAWIGEQYGSVERAEKDWGCAARRDKSGRVTSPPDSHFREDGPWRGMMAAYRRFMDNLTSRLWGKASRRLRELDPNHLVSFRQGNTLPHDFALSGPVKHIDFICPEGYAIRDTDEGEDAIGFITRYVDFTTGGKPVVWSEFGQSVWDNGRMAPDAGAVERQGRYSERFYRTALAAGANGTVPWWWVGGYREGERSDYGIVAPDRTERPSARLIRAYGPRLSAPREKPQPSAWYAFDRDAHAGGYCRAAFNEGAAAYRAAAKEGKALGVRTAGTGTDSATAPLVAVGNVPCDGTNPPKHLDAEFNHLQVFNADGVWQEAEDGIVITVEAEKPVRARASVGNTQEAAWLPGARTGGVALTVRVAGKEVGRWPVAARVPFLGDAAFGEFALLPGAGQPASVTVRMDAQGRTPFGEARTFTVKPK